MIGLIVPNRSRFTLWTEPLQGIEMVVLVIVIEDSLMDGVYKYMGNNQSTCECTKDK